MDLLFELIQVTLGQRDRLSRTPSEEEWRRLYQIAEEQTITSFVFPALEILDKSGQKPPMEFLYEWIGLAEQVRALNELMNKEAARLTSLFEKEGHQTAILKGQANARLYSNPISRQPGDIDIWVSGGKKRVVLTLMKLHLIDGIMSKKHSTEKEEDRYHHIHLPQNENGVNVEVHFRPSSGNCDPFTNRRLQKYLKQEIDRENEMVEEGFRVPSLRFALLMQLAHIQRHALSSGVGLRQIIDYYFLLWKWRKENEELRVNWRSLGVHHIAGALMWVMKEVLLMDEGWMIARPDEKRGRMLLDIIMTGGNFGRFSPERHQEYSFVSSLKYRMKRYELLRFDARETIWGEINYYGKFISSIPERIRRRSWTLRHSYCYIL